MNKKVLLILGILVTLYFSAVLVCNVKHNNANTLERQDSCGSCWALGLLGK